MRELSLHGRKPAPNGSACAASVVRWASVRPMVDDRRTATRSSSWPWLARLAGDVLVHQCAGRARWGPPGGSPGTWTLRTSPTTLDVVDRIVVRDATTVWISRTSWKVGPWLGALALYEDRRRHVDGCTDRPANSAGSSARSGAGNEMSSDAHRPLTVPCMIVMSNAVDAARAPRASSSFSRRSPCRHDASPDSSSRISAAFLGSVARPGSLQALQVLLERQVEPAALR